MRDEERLQEWRKKFRSAKILDEEPWSLRPCGALSVQIGNWDNELHVEGRTLLRWQVEFIRDLNRTPEFIWERRVDLEVIRFEGRFEKVGKWFDYGLVSYFPPSEPFKAPESLYITVFLHPDAFDSLCAWLRTSNDDQRRQCMIYIETSPIPADWRESQTPVMVKKFEVTLPMSPQPNSV